MKYIVKAFILSALCLVLGGISSYASKANSLGATITQPDGSRLTVFLHGDAENHWYTTADGTLLVQKGHKYFVASVGNDGALYASKQLAHEPQWRNKTERELVKAQDINAFRKKCQAISLNRTQKISIGNSNTYFMHSGQVHIPVLLIQFTDTTFSVSEPVAQFSQLLDSLGRPTDMGFGDHSNYETVRQYLVSCSRGLFEPRFDVYGVYTLDHPSSYYVNRRDQLISDALAKADADIDFSKYDSNNDGVIDDICAIYAGYSAATSGNDASSCIWPSTSFGNLGTYDGKIANAHCSTNELIGFPGCYKTEPYKRITGIGTFCHEFCHTLGLPDLYATSGSTGYDKDNQAMEYWSLMDGGEYVRNGYAPTALNAWEREVFGWEKADTLTEAQSVTLLSYDKGGKGMKILNPADTTNKEYILLENVQLSAANAGMRGHGLVVYRVDYNTPSVNTFDAPNNTAGHPQITVLPADSMLMSQTTAVTSKVYNAQIAGDPYPGTTLRDSITSFAVYNGGELVKPIYNIVEADGVITFDFLKKTPTAINAIRTIHTDADNRIYTVSGQYVGTSFNGLTDGIYIRNGKKVILRNNN